MTMISTCFLTEIATPIYFLSLENNHFLNIRTKSQTTSQGQAPSCDPKKRNCYRQWDQNIGTKDATFMASSLVRLDSYSDVVNSWLWNQQFTKVGPPPSLLSTTPCKKTDILMLAS